MERDMGLCMDDDEEGERSTPTPWDTWNGPRPPSEVAERAEAEARHTSDERRRQAADAARNLRTGWISLGRVLVDIEKQSLWAEWGYPDLTAYARDELRLGKKGLWRARAPYKALVAAGVDPSTVDLEHYKALEIAPVIDKTNVREWLGKARTLPVRKLKKAVREHQGKTGRVRETISFNVFEDQGDIVRGALSLVHKNRQGPDAFSDAEALAHVCLFFSAHRKNWNGGEGFVPVPVMLGMLEIAYGGRFFHEPGPRKSPGELNVDKLLGGA